MERKCLLDEKDREVKVGRGEPVHMSVQGDQASVLYSFFAEMIIRRKIADSPIFLQLIMCGPAKTENRSCQIESKLWT